MFKRQFPRFQILFEPEESSQNMVQMQIVAQEKTWLHQRRKRREAKRAETGDVEAKCELTSDVTDNTSCDVVLSKKRKLDGEKSPVDRSQTQNNLSVPKDSAQSSSCSDENMSVEQKSIEDVEKYVVKASLTLRKAEDIIRFEMLWIDGESKELLHQIMQLLKNKLK